MFQELAFLSGLAFSESVTQSGYRSVSTASVFGSTLGKATTSRQVSHAGPSSMMTRA